jgi:hypothetical protein
VWCISSRSPGSVAEVGSSLGRADNVREDDGCEDTLYVRRPPHSREELLDLTKEEIAVGQPMVDSGQLNGRRVRNPRSDVAGRRWLAR